MADIRIDSLPVADYQQPSDMFALQRNVAGVWTDFRSNFSIVGGDVQVVVATWDMATPFAQQIVTPGVDEIAVYLNATLRYQAANTPLGGGWQIDIYDGGVSQLWASSSGFSDGIDGGHVFGDVGAGPVNAMDTGIYMEQSVGPNVNGTATVIVQYLIVRI